MRRINAFTLIEVLLVLGIISIFLALSITAFVSARKSARDGRRKADLEQLRGALETYKTDNNAYPGPPILTYDTPVNITALDQFLVSGSSVYISKLPTDPNSTMNYSYKPVTTGYYLCASLETSGPASVNCATASCGTLSGNIMPCNYEVKNP